MANIKSAKKRIRVIENKTQRNRRVKSHLKEILKDFEAAIAAEDQKTARNELALAEKRLMQAASKGTIHKNTASRKVSRITAAFIKAFGKEALLEKAETPEIPDKSAKKTKKEAKPEKKAKVEAEAADEPETVTEEEPVVEEEPEAVVEEIPEPEAVVEEVPEEPEPAAEEEPVAESEAAEEEPEPAAEPEEAEAPEEKEETPAAE